MSLGFFFVISSTKCSFIFQHFVLDKYEHMFYNNITGKVIAMNEREDDVLEMTNEEYRERIIAIFASMDRTDKLRFWYRYISAIEKGEV